MNTFPIQRGRPTKQHALARKQHLYESCHIQPLAEMAVLDIISHCLLEPSIPVEDDLQPAGRIWDAVLQYSLQKCGCLGTYWGRIAYEPSTVFLLIGRSINVETRFPKSSIDETLCSRQSGLIFLAEMNSITEALEPLQSTSICDLHRLDTTCLM